MILANYFNPKKNQKNLRETLVFSLEKYGNLDSSRWLFFESVLQGSLIQKSSR